MDLSKDVFRVLAAVAWADGVVAPAEVEALRAAATAARLSPAECGEVEAMLTSRVELESLGPLHLPAEQAELTYALAHLVSAADGVLEVSERSAVTRLGAMLGLDEEARQRALAASHAVAEALALPPSSARAHALAAFARAVAEG